MSRRIVLVNAALDGVLTVGTAWAQQILINEGGASFPYTIYSKWFDEYHKKFPAVAINYASLPKTVAAKELKQIDKIQ
jgi:phosphate transport system substrate-binding protein